MFILFTSHKCIHKIKVNALRYVNKLIFFLLFTCLAGFAFGSLVTLTESERIEDGQNIDEVSEIAMEDSKEVITVWCPKWNMEISPETEVMVFSTP